MSVLSKLNYAAHHFRFFEFDTRDAGVLPTPPDNKEKYLYAKRSSNTLLWFSVISICCMSLSFASFIYHHPIFFLLILALILNILYFLVSFAVNFRTKDFDLNSHFKVVKNWKPFFYPSVDVFLPTAGEDFEVIRNTWIGVAAMAKKYPGKVTAYSLDDGADTAIEALAEEFKFKYVVRPNRGYYKKAGNLRYGFKLATADYIVIFDADFIPRSDFLFETLPYFDDSKLGILQTPQYFSVSKDQNWLERGAGAVQELFYRFSQVSRQSNGASICVGSNAVYRRKALESTGGTALIEHSEDVHTGFNLRMKGWSVCYIPIILAKGLCPASMQSFFKQQYRWCMGSMSLLSSEKFWKMNMNFKTRLSYCSGFLYYIHTALMSFYTPILPLILLIVIPAQISIVNYYLILPAFVFSQIIYPMWHKSIYGIEAWATRSTYGWAHLFAIIDHIRRRPMGWVPTGGVTINKNTRYFNFRILQIVFNLLPAIIWVSLAFYYFATTYKFSYLPILFSGLYYFLVCAKVSFSYDSKVKINLFETKKVILQQENI